MAWHGWHRLVAGLAIAVTCGCGGETGIVVEVTRDPDTTPETLDRLRVFVGVESGAGGSFVNDRDDVDRVDLGGRDIFDDPYRFLLRPEQVGDAQLRVAVAGYEGREPVGFASIEEPMAFVPGRVLRWRVELVGDRPFAVGDTGCLRWGGEGGGIASPGDRDCDGDPANADCDDLDPQVGPSQAEVCANGVDDDCDGDVDEESDEDGDGVTNCDGDCDDGDRRRSPENEEICDGIDNDCSGVCDDGELDRDEDGYNICGTVSIDGPTCSERSDANADCDDDREDVHPEAEETCDGVDNDCNGTCDDGYDPDGDGFTSCGSVVSRCDGVKDDDVDCRPEDPHVHPGAEEICDGVDTDCDGRYHPQFAPCYVGGGDSACRLGAQECDEPGDGRVGECNAVGDETVSDELCRAYDQCLEEGSRTPFECANQSGADQTIACALFHREGQMCSNARSPLPEPAADVCTWVLPDGREQGSYDARLESESGAGSVVTGCIAALALTASVFEPPAADDIYVHRRADGATTLFRLQIQPKPVEECPEAPLQCP